MKLLNLDQLEHIVWQTFDFYLVEETLRESGHDDIVADLEVLQKDVGYVLDCVVLMRLSVDGLDAERLVTEDRLSVFDQAWEKLTHRSDLQDFLVCIKDDLGAIKEDDDNRLSLPAEMPSPQVPEL